MLTKLRRVKQWQTFARTWWLYDAKWQDPYDSGLKIARYLRGKHKPIWQEDLDCGDHVVVINGSQVALPNEEWKWRHFFHNTQFGGGQNWASAWLLHSKDPTFVLERAIYKFSGHRDQRYRDFARLILLKDDKIPDDIREKISAQIRQVRQVPRKLIDIPSEELEKYPKVFDYDRIVQKDIGHSQNGYFNIAPTKNTLFKNATKPAIGSGPVRKLTTNAAVDKDLFGLNNSFSIEELMAARVHLGHKIQLLNPHMRPYIFGQRLSVSIIDLEATARMLRTALNVTAEIAYRGGIILFIHKPGQCGHIVEQAAQDCGEFAYCRKWLDAVFTNSTVVFKAVTRLPDLCIVFSALNLDKPHMAIKMAAKMLIPTIGICDTNASPTLVTYPVPGNDDSPQSIELYCNLFKTAVLKGKEKRKEILEKNGEDFYYKTMSAHS